MNTDDIRYALGRARRLVDLLQLALDETESAESRAIAARNADEEVGILAASPLGDYHAE